MIHPIVGGECDRVVVEDGCRIAVHTLRTGGATIPILFIHALAMTGEMWRRVAQQLNVDASLYAIDCRGHGESDRAAGPYTTERFAKDIGDVLDHLHAQKVHLIGCSMGGTVALAFAGRHPERVASMTIIDSTACYGENAHLVWDERALRPRQEGFQAMVPFQVSRWFSEAFAEQEPDLVQEAVRVFLVNDADAYAETCRMLGRADERHRLSQYTGPVSVVVGEEDYATPVAMARELVSLLTQAKLTILPKRRHYTPIECPEEVALAIHATILRG
ncbi:alpha/beta fold hydrolase [Bordetella tumulicola]|uniref:alpha/beta fold hydrolase n=1 Tax=Bordetella tumulicola TaxID=1649133 RepID=UPI0039F0A32C